MRFNKQIIIFIFGTQANETIKWAGKEQEEKLKEEYL